MNYMNQLVFLKSLYWIILVPQGLSNILKELHYFLYLRTFHIQDSFQVDLDTKSNPTENHIKDDYCEAIRRKLFSDS